MPEADTTPSSYGDVFADVYDDWYREVSDVDATVDHLAALAAGRPVLELGVGTGRLAVPLAARGIEVHGVDASDAMLERLAARPGSERVRVWHGDMAALELSGAPRFGVVFAAFNTFFNLSTAARQRACFSRCAALLAPGGSMVVEAVVPADLTPSPAAVDIALARDDLLVIQVSEVAEDQVVSGRHVELRGGRVRVRPWRVRLANPAQLDAMAADAGLGLRSRSAGWQSEAFDDASAIHVSRWCRNDVAPR